MCRIAMVFTIILSVSACSRDKRYQFEGQVLAVDPARQEITVKHGDISGFMPGMTMPFKVRDGRSLQGRKPGELIKATLVVTNSTGRLEDIVNIGEAPLPADAAAWRRRSAARTRGTVADAAFVDQSGRERRLSDWRGKTLAVTFVYTRCPLPDFCPLMDRNFAAVQRALVSDQRRWPHPPAVGEFRPDLRLAGGAGARTRRRRAPDPMTWTWLTGDAGPIDAFAAQFGVSIIRDDRPMQEITHNLRTIVIDRAGRVVKIYNGNDWKPEELLATLRAADAPLSALQFSRRELRLIDRLRTPLQVQRYLNATAVQHRAAARSRHAAKLPRRRPPPHGPLPRSGAGRSGDPRAARLSAARPQLRIDRQSRSRAVRLPATADAGARSPDHAIPGCTAANRCSAPPAIWR